MDKEEREELLDKLNAVCLTDEVRDFLYRQQPADIAELIRNMDDREEQKDIIKILEAEDAAEVLNELEDAELAAEVLTELPEEEASDIVSEMSYDDAADLIAGMDEEDREAVLELFEEEDIEDVQELLSFADDTAGGLMTTEYVATQAHMTAAATIDMIRSLAPDAETIYYIYVIDSKEHLVGVLSLRELIVAKPFTRISEIMWPDVKYVNVDDDQEDVANVVSKYNFVAIPVVDNEMVLRGIITVDDVIDVIHDEATEDLLRMAGTGLGEDEDERGLQRFTSSIKSRLPWLLITIIGGICSGQVLDFYSEQWTQVIALTFFVPLVLGMAGNVGTQSSTVTVRGIATGTVSGSGALLTILRECATGVTLGLIIGIIVAAVTYVWQQSMMLGVVIGVAIMCSMFTAATIGTAVPIVLKKFGVDPAVSSAPFISTTSDIIGLVIYAALAKIMLGL